METLKQFFNGFKKGVEIFGSNISIIINSVLLSIVYVVAGSLTHLAARLAGKHFLDTKILKTGTYWVDLNLKKKDIKEYYRQF